jgi:hypothetical protein
VKTSHFLLIVEFWTSFWLVMLNVSILYSAIFMEHNGGYTSHPQWHCVTKKHHLHYDSGSVGPSRLSNGCACALLWAVLKPILHKLYKMQVIPRWFHEQNHNWCVDDAQLHW